MRTALLALLVTAVAATQVAAVDGPSPDPSALSARLERSLAAKALRGARVAALVVDYESGETLYAHDADRLLIPASNLKILTAVAALRAFGPTYRFDTEVLADAAPDADGAVRALYVRGGGDPALTSEDLWRLAADLHQSGLRRVRGPLVLDDSRFDGQRWHPSWGPVSARAYHAPIGALNVNYGAFGVRVAPGEREGDPLQVSVDPPIAYLHVDNGGLTAAAGARSTLSVDRRDGSGFERVVVRGRLPLGREPKTVYRSVLDPARYAGAVLRLQLAAVGIEVEGDTRMGYAPAGAVSLERFSGAPLSDVVHRFLKFSNNAIGESLLKALGAEERPGSWARGGPAVRRQLEGLGLPLDGAVLVDGSGLSYDNRVSPRLLVEAVRRGSTSFDFGAEFVAALPIASSDGTLEERVEGAPGLVRAKTGLLTRVTGLSGLARRPDGRVVAFSILVNGFRGSAERAMSAVDGFAEVLVSPTERPARRAQDAPDSPS